MSGEFTSEEIKQAVKDGYTERLASGSCCCGRPAPATIETKRRDLQVGLGYTPAQLAGLPEGAVASAFGCGNPLGFAEVRPGETVLDIGSGAGIDCLIAARAVGPAGRVIGLDMTDAMIEKARENARAAGAGNVEFRHGDAEAMPVEDASVDWVVSNCVINLAPDKPAVFREVARVLRPGGRVAISDIVLADDFPELPAAIKHNLELYVGCVAGAVPESTYLAAMRAAGLEDAVVTARRVFGEEDLGVFFAETAARLGGGDRTRCFLEELRGAVVGKVWSARIAARKPEARGPATASPAAQGEPVIAPASEADRRAVEGLLELAGLPANHVSEHLADFLVARAGGAVVGCVGLERYGGAVLLRSLAVHPSSRGRGLGRRLTDAIIARARALGARQAVILTSTAQTMASRAGFVAVPRESLPREVRESWEFVDDCCGTAACMRLEL